MSFVRCLFCAVALSFAFPVAAQVSFSSTTYPAPSNSYQGNSVAADVDRDGNPDIVTVDTQNPQLLVWYGIGGGKFGSPEVIGGLDDTPQDVAVGDFNGDGKIDVVATISGNTNHDIDVLINNGNRTFSKSTISFPDNPSYIVVADFNNDGKLDFAVSSFNNTVGTYIRIYTGNGDGTFNPGAQLIVQSGSYHLMAADLNKDGKIDLINVAQPTTIFLNSGNGAFVAAQTLSNASGLPYEYGSLGDLNGDAAPDLLLTNPGFCGPGCGWKGNLDSYLNDGTGHFTLSQSSGIPGSDANFGLLPDLNYDRKLDMVFSSFNDLYYALGNGNGTFGSIQKYGPLNSLYSDVPSFLLSHDFNNDGLMDIASVAQTSTEVFLNTSVKPDCVPPNSASLGSTVCSPVSGQTVNLTFPVRAAANGPLDILRIEEWLDGRKVYQSLSNQVSNNLSAAAGSHTLSVISVDVLGNIERNTFAFTVNNCTAPATPGVRICAPSSGATVNSPVSFVATASPMSGTYITALRLYVDNVAKSTESGNSLSASVALSAGSHYIAVIGYQSNGGAQRATETINVR